MMQTNLRSDAICIFLAISIFTIGCSRIQVPKTSPEDFVELSKGRVFFRHWEREASSIATESLPILFLHGIPDHSGNQLRLLEGLRTAGPVMAYDRLGMGLSEKPDIDYSLASQVEEIREFLDRRQISKVNLVGHSLGGLLAIKFAGQYPNRVSRLVLMSPVVVFEGGHSGLANWDVQFLRAPILGEIFVSFQTRFATKTVLKWMFYDKARLTDEVVDSYHFPFYERGAKRHFLGTIRSLFREGTDTFLKDSDRLASTGIPILVIWPRDDKAETYQDAKGVAKRVGGELRTIERCGHLPQIELDSDRLNSELLEPIQRFFGMP